MCLSRARWDPAVGGWLDWAAATMRRENRFPRGYGSGLLRTEREPRDNGLFRAPLWCSPERRGSQIFGRDRASPRLRHDGMIAYSDGESGRSCFAEAAPSSRMLMVSSLPAGEP